MRLHNPHFNPSYCVPVPSKHLCRAVFLSVCSSKVHACMTCREGARGNRQCFNWRWTCQLYILTLDIFMPRKAHFSACSLQLLSGVNCVFMCACARTCVHVPHCVYWASVCSYSLQWCLVIYRPSHWCRPANKRIRRNVPSAPCHQQIMSWTLDLNLNLLPNYSYIVIFMEPWGRAS